MAVAHNLQAITPQHRLLLRAALGTESTAVEAWQEWRDRVNFEAIDFAEHRLLPLLARRPEVVSRDDPIRDLVHGIYRQVWVKNQLLVRDAAEMVRALEVAGVPSLVLKGAALTRFYGDDPGARPMYDVDLLVPRDAVPEAAIALGRAGWRPDESMTPAFLTWRVVPRRHSISFSRDPDGQLDLHWHVLRHSLADDADCRFWEAAVPVALGRDTARGLAPPDLFLHVLVHGAQSDNGGHVQWVADAVAVLRSCASETFAARVASEARRHGMLLTVRQGLTIIDEIIGGDEVAGLLARTEQERPLALERVSASRGWSVPGGRAVVRVGDALLEHGGGSLTLAGQARAMTRSRLDLQLARRPWFATVYAALGGPAWLARAGRRVDGTFVRTPLGDAACYQPGTTLDFTDAATSDAYGGPGWWRMASDGLVSHGREARVVMALPPDAPGDLELFLTASSDDERPRPVEVRVNEQAVATIQLAPAGDARDHRISVPNSLARRFTPLEVAFALPTGRGHGGRVKLRLVRLRLGSVDGSSLG